MTLSVFFSDCQNEPTLEVLQDTIVHSGNYAVLHNSSPGTISCGDLKSFIYLSHYSVVYSKHKAQKHHDN